MMVNWVYRLLNYLFWKGGFILNILGVLQGEMFYICKCQICKGEEIGLEMEILLII